MNRGELFRLEIKSISSAQAKRFTKFRERKGLIEKDVIDPFKYSTDILLTYSFYNFDLGYCQLIIWSLRMGSISAMMRLIGGRTFCGECVRTVMPRFSPSSWIHITTLLQYGDDVSQYQHRGDVSVENSNVLLVELSYDNEDAIDQFRILQLLHCSYFELRTSLLLFSFKELGVSEDLIEVMEEIGGFIPIEMCVGKLYYVCLRKHTSLASSQAYNFSASVCSWQGVSCDANREHVVGLVFSGMNLSGTVPDNTIGKLGKLQTLDLSHNNITGLPSDFWSLSSLKNLNLSSNHISGSNLLVSVVVISVV
ncbi:LRR receptor-like serine/threonine-protein [Vigna angularis]|uniref:LRR receptor-like serine/threonine-protein n=1 Tax=Phaseolus angularis TaxID=3914 RepID=A0A8T0JSU2_PHAAN|nr:LRR receptor-like serine/threonine-protein [Vigna angularis]